MRTSLRENEIVNENERGTFAPETDITLPREVGRRHEGTPVGPPRRRQSGAMEAMAQDADHPSHRHNEKEREKNRQYEGQPQ